MAEAESLNTLAQNSYVEISDGVTAVRTTADGSGTPSSVSINQTDPNNLVRTAPNTAARTQSITGANKVAAPGAAAVIATTASLAVGIWDVEVTAFITGTTVANLELDNLRVRNGTTVVGTIIVPVSGTTGATENGTFRMRMNINPSAAISVITNAAATASSIYAATISCTRVV